MAGEQVQKEQETPHEPPPRRRNRCFRAWAKWERWTGIGSGVQGVKFFGKISPHFAIARHVAMRINLLDFSRGEARIRGETNYEPRECPIRTN
jgi:hypothetical protein